MGNPNIIVKMLLSFLSDVTVCLFVCFVFLALINAVPLFPNGNATTRPAYVLTSLSDG